MVLLPNGDRAIVDIAKLRAYTLNPHHAVGGHKARVFKAALGIGLEDAEKLAAALRDAAAGNDATLERRNGFGAHFSLHFHFEHMGRSRELRSLWTIRPDEDFPRYVSAFVVG
jgi:hypothetical protein